MKLSPVIAVLIVIFVLFIAGLFYFVFTPKAAAPTVATSTPPALQNSITYSCDAGTVKASYENNSVMIQLSDGRAFTLPQTQSGSGIRYESSSTPDDIVFWSEGNNAFITENGTTTYSNCVANTGTTNSSTASSTSTFTDQGKTFSFVYPTQFIVSGNGVGYSTDWMLNTQTSGIVLAKLTIPSSFQSETNFVGATLTVGTSADPTALLQCKTSAGSGGPAPEKSTVIINGIIFTKFVSTDAAAGNEYMTTSYRTIRNNQCYALEYTIHSANIENYPPGSGIKTFNQIQVQSTLENIVQSFRFLP